MQLRPSVGHLVILLVVALIASACSTTGTTATTMAADMDMSTEGHSDMEMDMEVGFGDVMEAADAERVIEITANDDFTFDPAVVLITAGEIVTFRVTNAGKIPHDFTLGTAEQQDEHEAEMAAMSGDDMAMHDEPNVFVLQPGETKEMTWHMQVGGELIFGCHQPGHYLAGMKGTITIEG